MPVNPDSARDSGYFIYLVTVELGLPGARLSEGDFRHSGKWPRLPDRAPLMRCDGFIQTAPDCSAACGTIRCPATHPFGLESNLPLGMGSMLRCRKN